MGYYNKNQVIFLSSKKEKTKKTKTKKLLAPDYFIWEEPKPNTR